MLRAHLADAALVRRAALALAGAAAVVGLVAGAVLEPYTAAPGVAVVTVVLAVPFVLVRWLRRWSWHAAVLGCAGLAFFTVDATDIGVATAAAAFAATVLDPRDAPVLGWAAGLLGSVVATLDVGFDGPAPFLAVTLGFGLALLLRTAVRGERLSHETTALRDQTTWLEQRTALARELHDVVGHHVTAMVVQAEAGLVGDPHRALSSIGDLGRTALGELDALVVHLRDTERPLLVSAPPRLSDIDELLAAPLRSQGVDVVVGVASDLEIDEMQTLTLYRVAQESLTNIARHAKARSAWVSVGPFADRLRLQVVDDGIGPPAEIGRGSGLVGIDERVRAAQGIWAMTERPGGGTVVDVFLPLASSGSSR